MSCTTLNDDGPEKTNRRAMLFSSASAAVLGMTSLSKNTRAHDFSPRRTL